MKHGQRGGITKPVQGGPAVLATAHQLRCSLVEKKTLGVPTALSQWQAATKPIQCHVSWIGTHSFEKGKMKKGLMAGFDILKS